MLAKLVRKLVIISKESKVASSFSNLFENAMHSLCIKTNEYSNENMVLKIQLKLLLKNNIRVSITA